MPRGNEYPACECGRAIKQDGETCCAACRQTLELSRPVAGNIHPIFAQLIVPFMPGA